MREEQTGAVCWYQKAYGFENWSGGTNYGPVAGSDYDDSVQVTEQVVATGTWMEFDMTDIVNSWSAGTLANNGVCLYPTSKPIIDPPVLNAIGFHTSDDWAGDPGTAHAPELVVAFKSALRPGDADSNGTVNAADAAILAANWLATGANWEMGDFNGDGVVNDKDATLMATNWSGSAASAPEPSLVVLLCAAAVMLAWKRRIGR